MNKEQMLHHQSWKSIYIAEEKNPLPLIYDKMSLLAHQTLVWMGYYYTVAAAKLGLALAPFFFVNGVETSP